MVVAVTLKLPARSPSCQLWAVPHLLPAARLWAASPERTGQPLPPECATGAAVVVVGVHGSEVQLGGEGSGRTWSKGCIAQGKGEPGGMLSGGKENDIAFSGSTKMQ